MKKIKNWQFNPSEDEKDKQPTEPRFNPFLRSTMMSDTPDNETRPQCTKTKAIIEEEQKEKGLVVDLNNNSINKIEAFRDEEEKK